MALDSNLLAQAIISAVGIQSGDSAGTAAMQALASAIVNHIKTNAVVTLTPGTCLASGVTSGGSTAPVTGTGTIS